jgi:hypothetical protein
MLGNTNSEFEDGRHRLAIAMGAKPESKALGEDLHTQIVAQHLRGNAAEFLIASDLDNPTEQAQAQAEV